MVYIIEQIKSRETAVDSGFLAVRGPVGDKYNSGGGDQNCSILPIYTVYRKNNHDNNKYKTLGKYKHAKNDGKKKLSTIAYNYVMINERHITVLL